MRTALTEGFPALALRACIKGGRRIGIQARSVSEGIPKKSLVRLGEQYPTLRGVGSRPPLVKGYAIIRFHLIDRTLLRPKNPDNPARSRDRHPRIFRSSLPSRKGRAYLVIPQSFVSFSEDIIVVFSSFLRENITKCPRISGRRPIDV